MVALVRTEISPLHLSRTTVHTVPRAKRYCLRASTIPWPRTRRGFWEACGLWMGRLCPSRRCRRRGWRRNLV